MVEDLARAARELAASLAGDIELCKTREEHVRVTARANAARELSELLDGYLVSILRSTD